MAVMEDKQQNNLIKESWNRANHDHTFRFGDIATIGIGLIGGITLWNAAQKNEGMVRQAFNFPSEIITATLCKLFPKLDNHAVALGVRELYDVAIFSPIIVAAAMLVNKFRNNNQPEPSVR